ncbi:MAG: DUF4440 domain-containing protein [Candidatus Melainabacteria bacterium HGW-Melainabacteria-1]|nr:MAG: DUF4440 domain-containing protein [Candidatus Melainabacteria bacterium HGW-Melainabacteria-1]
MNTDTAQKLETLKQLFDSFRHQRQDEAEALFAEPFSFTSPYDDAIDKAAYFERCWPNAGKLKDQVIENMLVEGTLGYVTYQASTPEGMTFRNTECFHFDGNRICRIEVFFGAAYDQGVFARMR